MKIEERKDRKWIVDVIAIACVLLLAMMVLLHVFSGGLYIRYKDATGAKQFMQAAQLAQGNYHGGNISVIAYVQALFLRVASAFTPLSGLYKVFLVSEIALRMVEVLLFYCVVRNLLGGTGARRIISAILTALYFLGFPAISVLWGNYDYWNGNAILLLLFLFLVGIAEQRWGGMRVTIGKGKLPAKALIAVGVAVFFLSYYVVFWKQTYTNVLDLTATQGMFRNIYGDLIFFVPVFLFVVLHFFFQKRGSAMVTCSSIALLLSEIFLYVQWYQEKMDSYYYYLNQYNLWVMGWILVAAAIPIARETRQLPVAISYAGMCVVILALVVGGFDRHMWNHNPSYNNAYSTTNLCAVYRQTLDGILQDYSQYEYDFIRLEQYADVAMENEKAAKVAILTADEATQYWFDGITGANSEKYRLDLNEFPDIIRRLEEEKVEVLTVPCISEVERQWMDVYSDYIRPCMVSEKDGMLTCKPMGNGWMDVSAMTDGYDENKRELFEMAAVGAPYAKAPLLADKSSYLDYIMYENITGENLQQFYTWHYSPVDNINHLNEQGIRYVIVLYDDLYYQQTQPYFDTQEVVYENEAGCILTYSGDLWATSY